MASSSASIAAGFLRASALRPRLADDLRRAGIVPLPSRLVDEHKRDALEGEWAGWRITRTIARTLCLLQLVLWLQRSFPMRLPLMMLGILAVIVANVASLKGAVMLWPEHPLLAALACVPAMAFIAAYWLDETSDWITVRLDGELAGYPLGVAPIQVPAHLRSRAWKAEKVAGVRFEVDAIGEDPILYAARGWLWWTERVPIGAWETGTSLDHL